MDREDEPGGHPCQPGGGAKVVLVALTDATRKINGARVGFTMAPSGAVMLPTPLRVYDSRRYGQIGSGQTRIHSLAPWVPAGATAAIVNLTATAGVKSGGLTIYNTGSPLPAGSSLNWASVSVSNELHTKLPSDRRIKITNRGVPGCRVHYLIDLIGYLA